MFVGRMKVNEGQDPKVGREGDEQLLYDILFIYNIYETFAWRFRKRGDQRENVPLSRLCKATFRPPRTAAAKGYVSTTLSAAKLKHKMRPKFLTTTTSKSRVCHRFF